MIDVDEMRDKAIALYGLLDADLPYTLYYDETNNIRVLRNTPDGFNVREPKVFVLGGVAHRGAARTLDDAGLRSALGLGSNVVELKFNQIGKGELLDVLKSAKVETLLRWLEAEGLFIHFQALDPLYWSLVDIIDSILAEAEEPQLYPLAFQLKSDLYALLREDPSQVSELFSRYDFPNVGQARRDAFLRELLEIADRRQTLMSPFGYQVLKGVLQIALKLDQLPFLEDETPNMLIEGFSHFYVHRICLFKNAQHVLDIEETIMAKLVAETFVAGGVELKNHAFVDSKDEFGIQLADAVVGLLGRAFTYVNRTNITQIEDDLMALSDQQRRNLGLLVGAIDRSIEENSAFATYVISQEDRERMGFLLR